MTDNKKQIQVYKDLVGDSLIFYRKNLVIVRVPNNSGGVQEAKEYLTGFLEYAQIDKDALKLVVLSHVHSDLAALLAVRKVDELYVLA